MDGVKTLNSHATAEQVFEYVTEACPSISKATVYRNMSQMVERGDLLHIGNFHGAARYDHNLHEHSHFVCDNCKKVFDIKGDFSGLHKNIENEEEFEIKNYHLSFSGLCKECKT